MINDAEYPCREKKDKNESEIHINDAVHSRQDLGFNIVETSRRLAFGAKTSVYIWLLLVTKNEKTLDCLTKSNKLKREGTRAKGRR